MVSHAFVLFISVLAAATLYLNNNDFSGPIPVELGRLTALTELLLSDNAITGSIPTELGDLADLSKLVVVRLFHLLWRQVANFCFRITESLTLDGNAIGGGVLVRAPEEVCRLRDDDLVEFTVDCPVRVGAETAGVICGIPTCCTSCR